MLRRCSSAFGGVSVYKLTCYYHYDILLDSATQSDSVVSASQRTLRRRLTTVLASDEQQIPPGHQASRVFHLDQLSS